MSLVSVKTREDLKNVSVGDTVTKDDLALIQYIDDVLISPLWIEDPDDSNSMKYQGKNDVSVQDQTTEMIELHFTSQVQDLDIAVNTNIDDTVVTITSVSQPTVGNSVCFKEGTRFYQAKILSVVSNGGNWDVTLDTPLDFAFTTAGGCSERNENLAVDGSTTPVVFSVSPALLTNIKWDITRMMFGMVDDEEMDDGKFAGIAALTRGLVFRVKDGYVKNIFNAKTNGELANHMYDVAYAPQAKFGSYGLRGRKTFTKSGVVIRLDSETADEFQIIVQDDLTGIEEISFIVNGHVVEE